MQATISAPNTRGNPNDARFDVFPLSGCGSEWTASDIFAAKDWFAQNCLKRALGFALVVMVQHGVSNHMLAEDAVLEWLTGRFDRMTPGFDGSRGGFCPYALKDLRLFITGTILKRMANRPDKTQSLDADDADGSHEKMGDLAERDAPHGQRFHEKLDVVHHVLKQLQPQHQEILLLASTEADHIEIAEKLGISEGTARVRLCRARAEARRLFNEEETGGTRRS